MVFSLALLFFSLPVYVHISEEYLRSNQRILFAHALLVPKKENPAF